MRRILRSTALAAITSALVLGSAAAANADTSSETAAKDDPSTSLLGGLGLGGIADAVDNLLHGLLGSGSSSDGYEL